MSTKANDKRKIRSTILIEHNGEHGVSYNGCYVNSLIRAADCVGAYLLFETVNKCLV